MKFTGSTAFVIFEIYEMMRHLDPDQLRRLRKNVDVIFRRMKMKADSRIINKPRDRQTRKKPEGEKRGDEA